MHTILVVEDNEAVRARLVALLRQEFLDSRVAEAADGAAALDLAAHARWDVVVLDISLPGESGIRVLDRLRALRSGQPVVMCSGHTNPVVVEGSFKHGALGYVAKPDAGNELAQAVRCVLQGQRYRSQQAGGGLQPQLFAPPPPTANGRARPPLTGFGPQIAPGTVEALHRRVQQTIMVAAERLERSRLIQEQARAACQRRRSLSQASTLASH